MLPLAILEKLASLEKIYVSNVMQYEWVIFRVAYEYTICMKKLT